MGDRERRERNRGELNRANDRGDFGPEGTRRFDSDERRYEDGRQPHHTARHEGPHWDDRRHEQTAGDWRWRPSPREGWQRTRGSGVVTTLTPRAKDFAPPVVVSVPRKGLAPVGLPTKTGR